MKTPRRNKIALAVRKAKVAVRLANGRTPAEQLAELDARLGAGKGAGRERARLAKLIAGTAVLKAVKVTDPVPAKKADVEAPTFKPLKAKSIKKVK